MRFAVRVVVAIGVSTAAGCRTPPPEGPKSPPAAHAPTLFDPAAIDRWLASELATRKIVGASLVIVRDGVTVLAKGYGTKVAGTQQPIDGDTTFSIGSVSKQLTCAAVMTLADEGKLALTDPVAKYYPELTRASDITLDDLGAHLAGYRDYYPLDYKDTRLEKPITPDEILAQYAKIPLDFEPRHRQSYSNTGFVLLGRIAEKVSGQPLAKLLDDRIFKPLKMTRTSLGVGPGAATGHVSFQLGASVASRPEADSWLFGAAGVYASAADLAKWDLAFANGDILTPASRIAMASRHKLVDGRDVDYGCGLGIRSRGGELVLQHTGAVEGFSTYNTFVPRTRSAVILMLNDYVDGSDLQDKMVSLLLQRPNDIPTVAGASPEDTALALVRQLQSGKLDRSRLGEDLEAYFDDKRIAEAASRLRALGDPTVTLVSRWERGALEATSLELGFPDKTLHVTMFRDAAGKVRQFLITP